MSIHSWTLETFDPTLIPKEVEELYQHVLPYITNFLTSPHPYRHGKVCPFVPKAIKQDKIYFTYYQGSTTVAPDQLIQYCVDKLTDEQTDNTIFPQAAIILFPQNFNIRTLLKIHIDNKLNCVKKYIMLGALYRESMAPSLHSEVFFPLRTPTPTLVLRPMVPMDLLFLDPKHYSIEERLSFLKSFVTRFSENIAPKVIEQVNAANTMIEKYEREINSDASLQ